MHHLAIMSLKGGTGKTTVAANLGRLIAERGRTLLVDLDPQNALGLHFGMPVAEALGISTPELDHDRLAGYLRSNPASVPYIPFGRPTTSLLTALGSQLRLDPSWLERRLDALVPDSCEYVVFDSPAARGPWLAQAVALADLVLVVLEACPQSYALLPELEAMFAGDDEGGVRGKRVLYVLNRVDSRRALSRDMRDAFAEALGDALVDVSLEDDEHVREAVASRATCIEHAPHSAFAASLRVVVDELLRALK